VRGFETATQEWHMPEPYAAAIEEPPLTPSPLGSLTDLDALVAEVGSTYPLLAYPADAGDDDERAAVDAMILAGLVKP
jgi:hypothetical protein